MTPPTCETLFRNDDRTILINKDAFEGISALLSDQRSRGHWVSGELYVYMIPQHL